jgi:hypothetical protein
MRTYTKRAEGEMGGNANAMRAPAEAISETRTQMVQRLHNFEGGAWRLRHLLVWPWTVICAGRQEEPRKKNAETLKH